ncbi:hypothetical protein Tco_1360306 [Tanacetum coccineum]
MKGNCGGEGEDGDVWKIDEGSVDGDEVLYVEGMCSGELWSGESEDSDVWKIGEGTSVGIKVVEGVKDLEGYSPIGEVENEFEGEWLKQILFVTSDEVKGKGIDFICFCTWTDGCPSLECHRCKSFKMELIEGEGAERDDELSCVMMYRLSDRIPWAILLLFP